MNSLVHVRSQVSKKLFNDTAAKQCISTACTQLRNNKANLDDSFYSRVKNLIKSSDEYKGTRRIPQWVKSVKSVRAPITRSRLAQTSSEVSVKRSYSDSGSSKKPPIREPGVPERRGKKEQEKKREKKERKPVVQVRDVATYRLVKSVQPSDGKNKVQLQNRWGVKLMKNVNDLSEGVHGRKAVPEVPVQPELTELPLQKVPEEERLERLRLTLITSGDEVIEDVVTRPLRSGDYLAIAEKSLLKYVRETDQEPSIDSEYYVPEETESRKEAQIWKQMVIKSMRRVTKEYFKSTEANKEVEAIFIQPEPPVKHPDMVKTRDV